TIAMPTTTLKSGSVSSHEDVLTLAEAATYLRVPASSVEQLASDAAIPARKIGGEWRFLRKALDDWLGWPGPYPGQYRGVDPRWMLDSPFMEEFIYHLEKRLTEKLLQTSPPGPKPGSKEAVLALFGIFRDEDDLEERLAEVRKMREEAG